MWLGIVGCLFKMVFVTILDDFKNIIEELLDVYIFIQNILYKFKNLDN